MKAPMLTPALRQFRHNDGSDFTMGYDYKETNTIIHGLLTKIQNLVQSRNAYKARVKELEEQLRDMANGEMPEAPPTLVNKVLDQIESDFISGDYTALEEFLSKCPTLLLRSYLPESN